MPIVEIPGVGQVEFPDSMDGPAISAAAKKLHFDAKVKVQQEADRKLYNPASDSFLGNIVPAAGAGMASILRAVGAQPLMNRIGLDALPQDRAEAAQLDAPLDAAPGGTTGRVLGGAALLAPTAFIPGANTAAGAALIGGGTGLLTTEGGLGDRAEGALYGAGGGLLGNLAGRVLGAGYRAAKGAAKGLVRPFTERGRDTIAGEAIERFATNPAALAGAQGGRSITGAAPTLAEATRDPGIATLQRAISTMDPDAAAQFLARDQANNAARLDALRVVAGTGPRVSGVRRLNQIASGQSSASAEGARSAAANASYSAARRGGVGQPMADAMRPQIDNLLERPEIQSAIAEARNLARSEGIDLGQDVGSVQGLQYVKQALDDAIGGLGPKQTNRFRLWSQTSSDLKSVLDEIAPALRQADREFMFNSVPVNRADVANRLLNSTQGAIRDFSGNRPLQANAFSRALNDEERLIQQATGFRGAPQSLDDFMTPSQMQRIGAVRDELETVSNLASAANGKGQSQTAKMLASQQLLRNIGGPLGMPDSWVESGISQTLLRPVQFAATAVEPRIHAAVARGLLDPAEAQRLIAIARNANTATPSELARLAQALSPGLLGYSAAQAGQ